MTDEKLKEQARELAELLLKSIGLPIVRLGRTTSETRVEKFERVLKDEFTAFASSILEADRQQIEVCGGLQNMIGGCGKELLIKDAYRCADCTAYFHRDCLIEHFKVTDAVKNIRADECWRKDCDEEKKLLRQQLAEARAQVFKESADIALGMTGPGNTPEQCVGYSNACREISAALREKARESRKSASPVSLAGIEKK